MLGGYACGPTTGAVRRDRLRSTDSSSTERPPDVVRSLGPVSGWPCHAGPSRVGCGGVREGAKRRSAGPHRGAPPGRAGRAAKPRLDLIEVNSAVEVKHPEHREEPPRSLVERHAADSDFPWPVAPDSGSEPVEVVHPYRSSRTSLESPHARRPVEGGVRGHGDVDPRCRQRCRPLELAI